MSKGVAMHFFIALLAVLCFVNAFICMKTVNRYKNSTRMTLTDKDKPTDIQLTKQMNRKLSKKGSLTLLVLKEKPKESYIPQFTSEDNAPHSSEAVLSVVLGIIFAVFVIARIVS